MGIEIGQVAIQFQSNLDEVFKKLDQLGTHLDKVLSGRRPIKVEIDTDAAKALDTIATQITVMSDLATKFSNIIVTIFDMMDGRMGNVQKQLRSGVGVELGKLSEGAEDGITNVFDLVTDGVKRLSPLILGSFLGIAAIIDRLIRSGFDAKALIPAIFLPAAAGGATILEIFQKLGVAIITLNIPRLLSFLTDASTSVLGLATVAGILFTTLKASTGMLLGFLARKPETALARFTTLLAALNEGLVGLLLKTRIIIERFGFWTSLLVTASVGMQALTGAAVGFSSAVLPIVGLFTTFTFAFRVFSAKVSKFLLNLRAAAGDGRAATTLFLRAMRQMYPILQALADNAKPIAKLINQVAKGGFVKNILSVHKALAESLSVIKNIGPKIDLLIARMEKGINRVIKAVITMRSTVDDTFTRIGRKGARDALGGLSKISKGADKLTAKFRNLFSLKGFRIGSLAKTASNVVRKTGMAVIRTGASLAAMSGGGLLGAYFFGKAADRATLAGWSAISEKWIGRHVATQGQLIHLYARLRHQFESGWKGLTGFIATQLGLMPGKASVQANLMMEAVRVIVMNNLTLIAVAGGVILGPLVLKGVLNIVKGIPALIGGVLNEIKPILAQVGSVAGEGLVKRITFAFLKIPVSLARLAGKMAKASFNWLPEEWLVKRALVLGVKIAHAMFGTPWVKTSIEFFRKAATAPGLIGASLRLGRTLAGQVADGFRLAGNILQLAIVAPFSKAAARRVMVSIGQSLGRILTRSFLASFQVIDAIKSSFKPLLSMFKFMSGIIAKMAGGAARFLLRDRKPDEKLKIGKKAPWQLSIKDRQAAAAESIKDVDDLAAHFKKEMGEALEPIGNLFKKTMKPAITWLGKALDTAYEKTIGRAARGKVRPEDMGGKEKRLKGEVDRAEMAKLVQDTLMQESAQRKRQVDSQLTELAKRKTAVKEEAVFQEDLNIAIGTIEEATRDLRLNLLNNSEAEKRLGITTGQLNIALKEPIAQAQKFAKSLLSSESEIEGLSSQINQLKSGVISPGMPKSIKALNDEVNSARDHYNDLVAAGGTDKDSAKRLTEARETLATAEGKIASEIRSREDRRAGTIMKMTQAQEGVSSVMEKIRGLLPQLAFASEEYTNNMNSLSGLLSQEELSVGERQGFLQQNNEALSKSITAFEKMRNLVPEKNLKAFDVALGTARDRLAMMEGNIQKGAVAATGFNQTYVKLANTLDEMDSAAEAAGLHALPEYTAKLLDNLEDLRTFGNGVRSATEAYGANQKTMGLMKASHASLLTLMGGNIHDVSVGNVMQEKANVQQLKITEARNERERSERLEKAILTKAGSAEIKAINDEINARNKGLVSFKEMTAQRDALQAEILKSKRIFTMESELRKGNLRVTRELMEMTGLTRHQLRNLAQAYKEGDLSFNLVDSQLKGLSAGLASVEDSLEKQKQNIDAQLQITGPESAVSFIAAEQVSTKALGAQAAVISESVDAVRQYTNAAQVAEKHLRTSVQSGVGRAGASAPVARAAASGTTMSAGIRKLSQEAGGAVKNLDELMAGILKLGKGEVAVKRVLDGIGRKITGDVADNKIMQFAMQFQESGHILSAFTNTIGEMKNNTTRNLNEVSKAFKAFFKALEKRPKLAQQAIDTFGIDAMVSLEKIANALIGLGTLMSNSLVHGISELGKQGGVLKKRITKVFMEGIEDGLSGAQITTQIQKLIVQAVPEATRKKHDIRTRPSDIRKAAREIDALLAGIGAKSDQVQRGMTAVQNYAAGMTQGYSSIAKSAEGAADEIAKRLGKSLPTQGPLRKSILAMSNFGAMIGGRILSGIGPLANATSKFAQEGIITPLGKVGKSFSEGLGKGMFSGLSVLKAQTSKLLKLAIGDQLPSSLPKYGPLRVGIQKMSEIAPLMGAAMMKGVGYLKNIAGKFLSQGLIGAFETVLNTVSDVIGGITKAIVAPIKVLANTLETVIALPGKLLSAVASAIPGVFGIVAKTIGLITKALFSFVAFVAVLPLRLVAMFTSVVGKVLQAVTKMIGQTITKLFKFIEQVATKLVQLQRQSVAVNVDINQYDRLTRAFELLGVQASEVQQAFLTLRSTVTQAIQGGELDEMRQIFAKIGIGFRDLHTMKPDEMFLRIVAAIRSGTLSAEEQNRVLQGMGAMYGTLRGAISDATADIGEALRMASAIPPIGEKGVQIAAKFKAGIELAKQAFERIKIIIFEELAPFVDKMISTIGMDLNTLVMTVLEKVRLFTRIVLGSLSLIVKFIVDNWFNAEDGANNFLKSVSIIIRELFIFIKSSMSAIFEFGKKAALLAIDIISAKLGGKGEALIAKLFISAKHAMIKLAKQAIILAKAKAADFFGAGDKSSVTDVELEQASNEQDRLEAVEQVAALRRVTAREMEGTLGAAGDDIEKLRKLVDGLVFSEEELNAALVEQADAFVKEWDVGGTYIYTLEGIQRGLKDASDWLAIQESNLVDVQQRFVGGLPLDEFAVTAKREIEQSIGAYEALIHKFQDLLETRDILLSKGVSSERTVKELKDIARRITAIGLTEVGQYDAAFKEVGKAAGKELGEVWVQLGVNLKKIMISAWDGVSDRAKTDAPGLAELLTALKEQWDAEIKLSKLRLGNREKENREAKKLSETRGDMSFAERNAKSLEIMLTRTNKLRRDQIDYNKKVADLGGIFATIDQALLEIDSKRATILETVTGAEAGADAVFLMQKRFLDLVKTSQTLTSAQKFLIPEITMRQFEDLADLVRKFQIAIHEEKFDFAEALIPDIQSAKAKLLPILKTLYGDDIPKALLEEFKKIAPFTTAMIENLRDNEREMVIKIGEVVRDILEKASSGLGIDILKVVDTATETRARVERVMADLREQAKKHGDEILINAAKQLGIAIKREKIEERIKNHLEVMAEISKAKTIAEQRVTEENRKREASLSERVKRATVGELSEFDVEGARSFRQEMMSIQVLTERAVSNAKDLQELQDLVGRDAAGVAYYADKAEDARTKFLAALEREGFEFPLDFKVDKADLEELAEEVGITVQEAMQKINLFEFVDTKLVGPVFAELQTMFTGILDGSINKAAREAGEKAKEAGIKFNASLWKVAQFAKKVFDKVFNDIVENLVKNLQAGLSSTLSEVFNETTAKLAQGLLAVGMFLLSQMQDSASIVKDTVDSAVASTEEIRGVISGTTTVAIKETEEAFRASMKGTENRLDTIIELMRAGRPLVAGGSPLGATGGTTI